MGPAFDFKREKKEECSDEESSDTESFDSARTVTNSHETNMSETKIVHIHRFNGQDYQLWKRQMEIYMRENKLKKYINGIWINFDI
ncbi:hypothetical protein TKK_0017711 [Trichogramma kaykai]